MKSLRKGNKAKNKKRINESGKNRNFSDEKNYDDLEILEVNTIKQKIWKKT